MKRIYAGAVILGALLIVNSVDAKAQGIEVGKSEFNNSCAVCHGTDGKGSGPLAEMLNQKVPDLTTLRKRNKGVFPFNEVYETIDGRKILKAHGTRDMPAWGKKYDENAPELLGPFATKESHASFVRGRILALIGYIDSLQEK